VYTSQTTTQANQQSHKEETKAQEYSPDKREPNKSNELQCIHTQQANTADTKQHQQ